MIIAKPEWFTRRKYGGWGVGIKTWQGAVYIAGMVISLIVMLQFTGQSTQAKLAVTGIWMTFLLIDIFDVMWKLKLDEREKMHEAISERNAAWGMMIVLVLGIFSRTHIQCDEQQSLCESIHGWSVSSRGHHQINIKLQARKE